MLIADLAERELHNLREHNLERVFVNGNFTWTL